MGEVYAVVVAAGSSTRMGGGVDKQFLEIRNKPVLQHTLSVFEETTAIVGTVLVAPPEKVPEYSAAALEKWGLTKLLAVVPGGSERQQSVWNGLLAVPFSCEIVLVHDGARPLVAAEEISRVIAAARENRAATLAVPVKDTVKEADEKGFVTSTPDRKKLWLTQTPQGFSYPLLLEAHRRFARCEVATDDASLVEAMGHPVKLIPGSYRNIKITTPEDLLIAEVLMKNV